MDHKTHTQHNQAHTQPPQATHTPGTNTQGTNTLGMHTQATHDAAHTLRGQSQSYTQVGNPPPHGVHTQGTHVNAQPQANVHAHANAHTNAHANVHANVHANAHTNVHDHDHAPGKNNSGPPQNPPNSKLDYVYHLNVHYIAANHLKGFIDYDYEDETHAHVLVKHDVVMNAQAHKTNVFQILLNGYIIFDVSNTYGQGPMSNRDQWRHHWMILPKEPYRTTE